jgi:hypothetical protein
VSTEPQGRKARPITDVTSTALGEKKWPCACRLFGMNSLKDGAVRHIHLFLGNDCKTNDEITVVARQWPQCNSGTIVGSGVFYMVRLEAKSRDRLSLVQFS